MQGNDKNRSTNNFQATHLATGGLELFCRTISVEPGFQQPRTRQRKKTKLTVFSPKIQIRGFKSATRIRNPSRIQPIDITCKICDVPPSHECDGCGHGVCSHPDCCSRYVCIDPHGNKNQRTVTVLCSDCISRISVSIVRVVSREGGRGTMPVAADSK